jgi:hypothetical protein
LAQGQIDERICKFPALTESGHTPKMFAPLTHGMAVRALRKQNVVGSALFWKQLKRHKPVIQKSANMVK